MALLCDDDHNSGSKRLCQHILEARPSLQAQHDLQQVYSGPTPKKCCSLSASRNSSIVTFIIGDDKPDDKLPRAPEPERELTGPENASSKGDLPKKQRELFALQTKLIKQQNEYIKLYAETKELMEANCNKDSGEFPGDVRIVSVKGWPAHDLMLLVGDGANVQNDSEVNGVVGPEVLHGLRSQLTSIPAEFLAMGTELLDQRTKILDFFREKRHERNFFNSIEWKKKNAEIDAETKRLHCLVEEKANYIEAKIIHSLHLAKMSWVDRDSLVHQLEYLQQMIYGRAANVESEKIEKAMEENQRLLEELQKERAARAALAEVVASAEGMITSTRTRNVGYERQLTAARAELAAAKEELKNIKLYNTRREATTFARIRKLENASKVTEEAMHALNCHRDALEIRVRELQQQTAEIIRNAANNENRFQSQIEALKIELEEQERLKKAAAAEVMTMEKRLKDTQDKFNMFRERTRELVALQRKNCLDFLPKKEVDATEKEIQIWNDLQATREALDRMRAELERSRADKDGLLESLAKIAQEGPKNRLAEELIAKERKISKLRKIIEEKKENERRMEQSLAHYEDQLAAFRVQMSRLQNNQVEEEQASTTVETNREDLLQAEVLKLSRRVVSLNRERAALASVAASRALMLERHERCAELFAQITRTRRQLAAQIETRSDIVREGPSNIEIPSRMACESADLAWPTFQSEHTRVQPLTPLERPVLEQLIQERTSQLEQEIIQQYRQDSHTDNTNEAKLYYDNS